MNGMSVSATASPTMNTSVRTVARLYSLMHFVSFFHIEILSSRPFILYQIPLKLQALFGGFLLDKFRPFARMKIYL